MFLRCVALCVIGDRTVKMAEKSPSKDEHQDAEQIRWCVHVTLPTSIHIKRLDFFEPPDAKEVSVHATIPERYRFLIFG